MRIFSFEGKGEDFKYDRKLHTLFSQMDELMSCSELSTKTNLRKNVEAKIDTHLSIRDSNEKKCHPDFFNGFGPKMVYSI